MLNFGIVLKFKNNQKNSSGEMQQLQMNPPWECGLISLIKSYLAFSFFHFSTTTLLKLGVKTLICCLVEHFNIRESEVSTGSTSIKSTGPTRSRVPSGEGVGVATVGLGIAVACSIIWYAQVVSTKGWPVTGTLVNSGNALTRLDVHLNRSVAIAVI